MCSPAARDKSTRPRSWLWLVWVLTAVLPMLGVATTGGDFEGYILLMGG
jgi:hypothetical protein